MPETIKQEALQLEPLLESCGACKFPHTFPMEKPFKYSPLKLPSQHMSMTYHSEAAPSHNNRLYMFIANGDLFAARYPLKVQ